MMVGKRAGADPDGGGATAGRERPRGLKLF